MINGRELSPHIRAHPGYEVVVEMGDTNLWPTSVRVDESLHLIVIEVEKGRNAT
jgi:hypothetical protein